jgi:hypothetical protein
MKKMYKCEVCEKTSESSMEIENCEDRHKVDEKRKTMSPEAIECPMCNGVGGYYGNDGCDWRFCGKCDGVGFVIPVNAVSYQKIKK